MRRAKDRKDRMRAPWLLAAALGAALLVGMWLSRRLAAFQARARARADNVRAQRAEKNAEKLLRRHGYRPVAQQARTTYPVQLGTQRVEVSLSADYIVERAGRRYVAEVKSGRQAPRFDHAETRRQLLEYQLGFAVDCVLLVDVEQGVLQEVRFPLSPAASPSIARYLWLAALMAGVGWLLMFGPSQ